MKSRILENEESYLILTRIVPRYYSGVEQKVLIRLSVHWAQENEYCYWSFTSVLAALHWDTEQQGLDPNYTPLRCPDTVELDSKHVGEICAVAWIHKWLVTNLSRVCTTVVHSQRMEAGWVHLGSSSAHPVLDPVDVKNTLSYDSSYISSLSRHLWSFRNTNCKAGTQADAVESKHSWQFTESKTKGSHLLW